MSVIKPVAMVRFRAPRARGKRGGRTAKLKPRDIREDEEAKQVDKLLKAQKRAARAGR